MHRSTIPLSFRCDQDWAAMRQTISSARRHCDRCARTVLDLSDHTELGARVQLARSRSPCVRYTTAPDGAVRFRPGLLARLGAALVALLPTAAFAAHPVPTTDHVHLCSTAPPPPAPPMSIVPLDPLSAARTGSLRLDVVDRVDTLPIPNVTIALTGGEIDGELLVTTDENGRAEVDGLAVGKYAAEVRPRMGGGLTITGLPIHEAHATRYTVEVDLGDIEQLGHYLQRRRLRLRRLFWSGTRPFGQADVHVAAEPGRWERVAVRCVGSTRPIREVLDAGEVLIDGIPEGGACEARLTRGDRPLRIEFTGGAARTEIEDP